MGLRESLDRANLNTLADQFRIIKLGQTMRQDFKTTKRKLNPDGAGVNAEDLATLDSIVLPDDAKAGTILRAFARAAGTGTPGELTVDPRHTTPGAGDIAISPAGNLVFLASEVWTDVDVEYLPERGDVAVTAILPVATNVLTLPTALFGNALVLLRADAQVGSSTGRKIVLAPGAGGPAAGQVRLNILGTTVTFAGADAVTSAIITVLVDAAVDLDALLEDDSAETL